MINVRRFRIFTIMYSDTQAIMSARNLPCVNSNTTAVSLIMNGSNIQDSDPFPTLNNFKHSYLQKYAVLLINVQFMEQGIKGCGYVALIKRGERIDNPYHCQG